MRWILTFALLLGQGAGEGNLQQRLAHRVDHGWIVTALEIDRDVVLPSEKQLLAVFKIEPAKSQPVSLNFESAEAAVFTVADAVGNVVWSSSWRLSPQRLNKTVPRSGWAIRLRIPLQGQKQNQPISGRCILQARLLLAPPLENRIAFEVR